MRTLKLIDTHFHLWDLDVQNLPWLETTDGTITQTYDMARFKEAYAQLDGVEFLGGVYVEVDGDDPAQEDELIHAIAQEDEQLLACMMRADVAPTMRVPAFAAGIREPLHIDSQPTGRCLEGSFVAGLAAMAELGLPFEACIRMEELGDLARACELVPQCTVIVNHMGNCVDFAGLASPAYREAMARLAACPNVYLKVSGYPTGDPRFVEALIGFAKEIFAPDRLLYASNWPVIDLYGQLNEHVRACYNAFGDDELFWRENARRCYSIPKVAAGRKEVA